MIESPSKDTRLRASWGSAVADAVNRHEAALSVKAARIANGRDAIGAPFPFQVIGGTDDGSAKLSIYVPQGSVVVADEEIDAGDIEGLSAVDDAPGYYTVDDLDDLAGETSAAQPLYLIIWRDDTETTPSTNATVTLDPESVDGTVILQATIALVWASTVTTSEGDSKTYGAVAEQIVRSAVHVGRGSGGGGGGGGTSGETGSHNFLTGLDIANTGSSASPVWQLRISYRVGTFAGGLLSSVASTESHIYIPLTLHSAISGGQGYS